MVDIEQVRLFRVAAQPTIRLLNAIKTPVEEESGRVINKVTLHNVQYVVQTDDFGEFVEMGGERWYLNNEQTQKQLQDEPLFTFYVNPQSLKVSKVKVITKKMTVGGIEWQHWGNNSHDIALRGTTGSLMPSSLQIQEGIETVYDTEAYRRLRMLETVYTYDGTETEDRLQARLLGLQYRRVLYVGHFGSFSIEEVEEQPWQLFFDAQFTAQFEATDADAALRKISSSIAARQRSLSTLREILGRSAVEIA